MAAKETPTLDIEKAYVKFRTTLLRALGGLARRGFAITPVDGIDLIHDFFVDHWEGICSNFDPDKGTFETYVYSAFVHFSRPRIVRLRRLQDSLVDPQLLDSTEATRDTEGQLLSALDSEFLVSQINRLPKFEREVLTAFLHSSDRSERSIGRQLAISRYRVREILIEALGRIVVVFPKPASVQDHDWRVARSVWGERRTIQETAVLFEMSVQGVKNSIARSSVSIARILRQFHIGSKGGGGMSIPRESGDRAADLLRAVLASPGNEQLLNDLKASAKDVLAVIESSDIALPAETEHHPLWTARVYEALSEANEIPPSPEQIETERALLEMERADLEAIGKAFVETLLPGLPIQLTRFDEFFSDATS